MMKTTRQRPTKRKPTKRKLITLVISICAMIAIGAGTTLAVIKLLSPPVENTFLPGEITCQIQESFDGETKENVSIKNTGDDNACIRAKIIVTWQGDGAVYATKPVSGTDYALTLGDQTNWSYHADDDTYYYLQAVAPGESTTNLIASCVYLGHAPEGYTLSVEIVADAAQPEAAKAAWGLEIE